MDNHVYILGAGFSVPLGGPLFSQLLTNELAVYCSRLQIERPDFWNGVLGRIRNGKIQEALGRTFDAEQLMHRIERMRRYPDEDSSQLVRRTLTEDLPTGVVSPSDFFFELDRLIKRVVASECEKYLDELEEGSDLWDPYVTWFRRLGPTDVIVTFNYDTTVERIADKTGRPFDRRSLCEAKAAGMPKLIKIHGSVDWARIDTNIVHVSDTNSNYDFAIGTPGLSKSTMHGRGHFKELWDRAADAIIRAECVSIIGYSMPQTDNRARMMIIDSLRAGRGNKKRVCIVLGFDSDRIRRMLSIIRPILATSHFKTTDTSMYAQDYLLDVPAYSMADY